ncbi:hypothetical protein [Pedobacter sp. B4-66]|uniref:hypothetical protein n=1 Tax=Pedobacter sp. B4-66 TaxID=2817280 RepID=UPI001BDB2FC1|nr:hypothetical protein [Pedobacter sp. B4-66]
MKRLFIGLFATGVALGASTFTSLASKRIFATYYYVLTEEGTYTKVEVVPDPSNCEGTASHKCFVGYATYKGESFFSNSMPAAPIVQSGTNGLYTN